MNESPGRAVHALVQQICVHGFKPSKVSILSQKTWTFGWPWRPTLLSKCRSGHSCWIFCTKFTRSGHYYWTCCTNFTKSGHSCWIFCTKFTRSGHYCWTCCTNFTKSGHELIVPRTTTLMLTNYFTHINFPGYEHTVAARCIHKLRRSEGGQPKT